MPKVFKVQAFGKSMMLRHVLFSELKVGMEVYESVYKDRPQELTKRKIAELEPLQFRGYEPRVIKFAGGDVNYITAVFVEVKDYKWPPTESRPKRYAESGTITTI